MFKNFGYSPLEVLVHLEIDAEDLPTQYQFLKIEAPEGVSIETVDVGKFQDGWQADPSVTRQIGDTWLGSRRTALLSVPSVLVPETFNILLNPLHANAAQVRIINVLEHGIDPRLV